MEKEVIEAEVERLFPQFNKAERKAAVMAVSEFLKFDEMKTWEASRYHKNRLFGVLEPDTFTAGVKWAKGIKIYTDK